MPNPTREDVHVDAVLTQISIAYQQAQDHFVATQVAPIVSVTKQSNKFFTYTKADWFRDEAEQRGDATESAGSSYNLSTDSYDCDVFAFHKMVGDQTRANADSPLDPDADAARFVTQRLLIRRERQFAVDAFAINIWATDKTVGTKWSNFATSDPIEDIDQGKETVLTSTGYDVNTLVLGYKTWRKLKRHPDFRAQLNPTTRSNITPAILGELLEVERVIVAKSIYNTSVEGNAVQTNAKALTTDAALLCYVNPQPSLMAPSALYTFMWSGISGGLGTTVATSRIRDDHKKADKIEGEEAYDFKIIGADLGYFFTNVVD